MQLTILQVAYPLAPVGIDATGGAEQILTSLDLFLTAVGHRSIVIACAGSQSAGTLWPIPALGDEKLTDDGRRQIYAAQQQAIEQVIRNYRVDVIHLHGVDFAAYLPPDGPPLLITLHLPLSWYEPTTLFPARARTFFNCVSAHQERDCPPGMARLPSVENGVATELFTAHQAKRNFVLALGRICPEKGFHLALDAATQANIDLILGGALFPYPEHERYFADEIAPRLDRHRRYVGACDFARKRRLLSSARCLVMPSMVAEPSSLVAMEALACGTPVIAFDRGALGEIIEHGKSGFLVRDVQEMADAIASANEIDPAFCRHTARTRFSRSRMAGDYFHLYERLAAMDKQPANTLAETIRMDEQETVSATQQAHQQIEMSNAAPAERQ